jgi:hypothetical protein
MLSLIVVSTINVFTQPVQEIEKKSKNESDVENPLTAYAGTLDISSIFFEHVKGTTKLKVRYSFGLLEIDNAYADQLAKSFYVDSLPAVYNCETGENVGDKLAGFDFSYHELRDGGYGQVLEGYVDYYMTNYGSANLDYFYPDSNVDKTLNYGASSSTTHSNLDSFSLDWVFYPIISLDSDYYNFGNIRVEVLDKLIDSWTEFDPTNIILSHPEYKLRIYDSENNNLIFEDTEYQFFAYYRDITLDSLKIQNNAPEPINASLIENGHYQGEYSFDLDTVNTQPIGWNDVNDINCSSYIVNEIDGHNKVLKIEDNSPVGNVGFTLPFDSKTSGSFEYWVRTEQSSLKSYFYGLGSSYLYFYITGGNFAYFDGTAHTIVACANDIWYHLRISFTTDSWYVWINGVEYGPYLYGNGGSITYLNGFSLVSSVANSEWCWYIDALDFSWADGYYEGRNQELNTSEDLWCWEAFPEWEGGHYQRTIDWGTAENPDLTSEISTTTSTGTNITVESNVDGHRDCVLFYDTSNTEYCSLTSDFTLSSDIEYEFWYRFGGERKYWIFETRENYNAKIQIMFNYNVEGRICAIEEGTSYPYPEIVIGLNTFQWYQIRIKTDDFTNSFEFYLDNILQGTFHYSQNSTIGSNSINCFTRPDSSINPYYTWIDGLSISQNENYFTGMNTLADTTAYPLPMETNYTTQVNPYSSVFTNYTTSNYLVGITDLYDNVLDVQGLSNSSEDNEIIYTPSNVRTCLIALSDQRSNYLEWQNYRLKINGSSLYEQYFYREIATIVNISVYDRFDQYLTSQVYTVERDDNFINIQLTLYSLKIYNQQEVFNYVNVTRDPNYYDTSEYWSEWLAPGEIGEFRLFEGYYKIEIESNENSTNLEYEYYLTADDILLLTSANTLTNTILSILNVNSTLGNQITNVEINITNQNSNINTSIINIDINLENINSTLGDQLINIDTAITNLNSDVDTLFLFTNNSLINLNSSLDSLFVNVETNILSINDSISTLIIDINNDIALLNASIDTQFTQISNDMILMESNLNTSIFNLDTTIDLIGDNITENYILLNNSLNLIDNEINESNIAILNYLTLVNNSIMESIQNMLTQVYLINNSIYNAVVNLGTSLSIDNNQILGNLSIILQLNEELTDLFINTMFSEYLDWTNATIDSDYIYDQTEYVDILNEYNTESLEILFKYLNETESLVITAQTTLSQLIPNENVTYRVKSLATGEYLDEWKPIPENKTIDLGFYSEEISITPEDIQIELMNYVMIVMIAVIALTIIALLLIKKSKELENVPKTLRKPKKSDPKFRGKNDMDIFRP